MKLAPKASRMLKSQMFLVIPVLTAGLYAGDAPTQPGSRAVADSTHRKNYSALFSELLRNLPPENRAKVDSATVARPSSSEAAAAEAKVKDRKEEAAMREEKAGEMGGLSQDVRDRVEKAVATMEERKKKALEFKDLRK